VACQGCVALVELPTAAFEQVRHHGLGIVPPHLARHTAKEREGLDEAVKDRLGPLRGQGQHERAIGVAPSRHQHRNLPAPVGEIDVEVTKVGFQTLAGIVIERDERLAALAALSADIMPHPLIAALVAVLGLQPPPELLHRVPLLARRLLVAGEDGIENRLERIQDGGCPFEPAVPLGLWRGQDLADLASRMMEPTGQLANAHPVYEMRSSHMGILVHRDHPPPPCRWTWCTSLQEVCGWARFRRGFCLEGGSGLGEDYHPSPFRAGEAQRAPATPGRRCRCKPCRPLLPARRTRHLRRRPRADLRLADAAFPASPPWGRFSSWLGAWYGSGTWSRHCSRPGNALYALLT